MTSQTALTAAAARAAHLIVDDEPRIFSDTLAAALLGDRAAELLAYHRESGDHPILASSRAQVVCRARVTEDRLAEGEFARYVVLGAGLDTYAYRNGAVEVVEVDLPATRNWKRKALAAAGIAEPENVTYADSAAGLDARRTLVSWLGVVMYLTADEIDRTLATLPPCELVVDHLLPPGLRDAAGDAYVAGVAPVAAQSGEPWRTFLSPEEMAAVLGKHGFRVLRQLRQRDLPEMLDRTDALRPTELSVVTHAIKA